MSEQLINVQVNNVHHAGIMVHFNSLGVYTLKLVWGELPGWVGLQLLQLLLQFDLHLH